ncbi:MAG: NAD(P)/FAD-dependent oxidoreductase [Terracidiphilus sp.]|jgi:phytoene dehydrogenase-like protein
MKQDVKKIVVVGGGIAGLCAAVYAQECGYQAEVLEMHDIAGGLATSWRRGHYTFETCLHWLYGSNPSSPMHSQWLEVCDVDKLTFVNQEEFGRVERENGDSLGIYTNVDRLEKELLKRAPQNAPAIRGFTSAIRRLGKFKMPDPSAGWAANLSTLLRNVPCLPLLRELMRMSCKEYGERFTDPLLKSVFGDGEMGQLSAIALFFSLAWMNQHDAAYAIGGAQALIRLIEERLASLGGHVRFGARVERILVEDNAAIGVQLAGGEAIAADWVISAADGHATIYDLLGGKYTDKTTKKTYDKMQTFPSYLQVSLGVAMDLAGQPVSVTRLLDSPLHVDPGTELNQAAFRIFNFDPTFAPAGKTAVTCFLPTRNFEYWVQLQLHNPDGYRAEKDRIAEAVIAILEKKIPGLRQAIEVTDVSTPATIIRYTGNWKGSMEGWFISPGTSFRPLPNTLPGLRQFMMVGQWIMPGGGLPSGPMTARPAIQAICKRDRVPFTPRRNEIVKSGWTSDSGPGTDTTVRL